MNYIWSFLSTPQPVPLRSIDLGDHHRRFIAEIKEGIKLKNTAKQLLLAEIKHGVKLKNTVRQMLLTEIKHGVKLKNTARQMLLADIRKPHQLRSAKLRMAEDIALSLAQCTFGLPFSGLITKPPSKVMLVNGSVTVMPSIYKL